MNIQKFNGLYHFQSYNVGFMGGMREPTTIDGHYTFVTDGKEFVIIKIGTYANLISITPDLQKNLELTEGDYRFVNDYIIHELRRYPLKDATDIADPTWDNVYGGYRTKMFDLWNTQKHYPLVMSYISANIHQGDTVIDLRTGENFVMTFYHDSREVNRNHNYKVVGRELHPAKMKCSDLLELVNKADPFSNWKTDHALPKNPHHLQDLTVDGTLYQCYVDYDKNVYYIKTSDTIYSYNSHISKPFYDALDIVKGFVCNSPYVDGSYVKMCLKAVVGGAEFDKHEMITEAESYDYNTRATYF